MDHVGNIGLGYSVSERFTATTQSGARAGLPPMPPTAALSHTGEKPLSLAGGGSQLVPRAGATTARCPVIPCGRAAPSGMQASITRRAARMMTGKHASALSGCRTAAWSTTHTSAAAKPIRARHQARHVYELPFGAAVETDRYGNVYLARVTFSGDSP